MIDTQAIRKKILDLAMRGQLTEQLPEDGTAEELYRQIQAEKQTLIKAGKIKKEKPLPELPLEEIPFSLPNSWKWVYLGDLFQHNTGKALNARDRQGQILDYITTSNLYWDHFELDELKQMPFTEAEIEKCTVKKGDLLVCEGGDIGRSAIWPFDYDMRIQNHIHRLRRYSKCICTEFYYYVLWFYKQTGRINGIGIGLQGFSSKRVHSLIVPLTSYKEALRIVEKIRNAFSILDTIDALQTQYADNLTALKAKLIDAAIQGKLTEQLPEDGTAEELYQQIQAEKQVLIKEGKIKKEKPLPEIQDEEIPFEIPKNWKWVRLSNLMTIMSTGPFGSMLHKTDYIENGIPVINPANIVNGSIVPSPKIQVSQETKERLAAYELHEKMIVMGRRGEMGRCAIVGIAEEGWLCGTGSFFMKPSERVLSKYVSFIISSPFAKAYLSGLSIGMTMNNLNQNILKNLPFPLPPFQEQVRISERIEYLYLLLEQ